MNKPVRVRFAPSPTGLLHIGGVRTALFNYLFAKANKGKFILRLEDTDRERFVEEGVKSIIESLDWLGLHPDEGVWYEEKPGKHGPYIQSKRLHHYKKYAERLVKQGLAYYSNSTPEQLEAMRIEFKKLKKPFVFKKHMEATIPTQSVKDLPIRLQIPPGVTKWEDKTRGEFEANNELIDDFVIIKADGFPTYNFANVIDDHLMQISHVIRGDEFIPSTAKHAILYDLLGFRRPIWVHLPLILGPDGKHKLSKRDGDVDVMEYKAKGYLPETINNFLALLGWNDGSEREIFTLDELINSFNLSRIQKSPAIFDIRRLNWMNGEYIRNKLTEDDLIERIRPFVPDSWLKDLNYFKKVLLLERERIKKLDEVKYLMEIFFEAPKVNKELLCKKDEPAVVAMWLRRTIEELDGIEFSHDSVENCLRSLSDKLAISPARLFYVLRVALTGRTEAPGLFDIFVTLGKQESLARIKAINEVNI